MLATWEACLNAFCIKMKSTKKDQGSDISFTEKKASPAEKEQGLLSAGDIIPKADRSSLEESQGAVGLLRHDGRLLKANSHFCKKFKLKGDLPSQNLLNSLSSANRRLLERKLLLAHHHGSSCELRLQHDDAKGLVKWRIQPVDGLLYLQEEVAPLSLTYSPAVSRQFLEIVPLPALLYSQKHELLMVNQAYAGLLEKDYFEAGAAHSLEGFFAAALPELQKGQAALGEGKCREFSCRVQLCLAGGERRLMEYREKRLPPAVTSAFPDAFSVAVLYDLSAVQQEEESLKKRQQEVDLLMDRASHDLKGPLKSMMSLYSLMEHEFGSNAAVMQYVSHYHNGISRLYRILQDMLQLTRLNTSELSYSRINLAQMIEDSLQSFKNLPRFYDIRFEKEIELPSEVLLEESLLQTIVQNLLENAIKYCAREEPTVRVLIRQDERGGIRLEVSDNGIGIPQELQPRVFDRFFRATRQASGSGLGLYLLKQAVDKLKGEVILQSSSGKGTTFTVYLPCTV